MSQPIQVGTCLNAGGCKHFVDYEGTTKMMFGYQIYNNKEIYNSLDEGMKEHFYKNSNEYRNMIMEKNIKEQEELNKKKQEMHYKILNIKDEEIKECDIATSHYETYPSKHNVKIVDKNDNVYETVLFFTDIYDVKPIYDRLSSDMKNKIDKQKERFEKEKNILLKDDRIVSINGIGLMVTADYTSKRRNVSCYSDKFNEYLLKNNLSKDNIDDEIKISQDFNRKKFDDIKLVKVEGFY
jgi:hypothetical protein